MAEVDPGRFPIDAFEHDVDDGELYLKTGWDFNIADNLDVGGDLTVTGDLDTTGAVNGLKPKVIEIGDWNMDANSNVDVAHGLGAVYKAIRAIKVIVRDDADADRYPLDYFLDADDPGLLAGGVSAISNTNITLRRRTGGAFDSVVFDATTYNRGWITVWYET